ncbi:MAG: OsmC family protein [Bacillota bacterium]|jgi:putative redox protein|nr:OsmC family protein [Candidatus Fermentithermobacillaceae bacterium]
MKVSAILYDDRIEYANSRNQGIITGSEGPSPMELLLMSVAGCSGLTLESLLERDGYAPDKLELAVEGKISEKAPRRFTEIHISYDIQCEGLDKEAFEKYLKITERVCPVVQSLSATIHLSYALNEQK